MHVQATVPLDDPTLGLDDEGGIYAFDRTRRGGRREVRTRVAGVRADTVDDRQSADDPVLRGRSSCWPSYNRGTARGTDRLRRCFRTHTGGSPLPQWADGGHGGA
jgi:hypothetical protein